MIKCSIFGTEIVSGSTASELLVCIPCRENRSLFNDQSKNIRSFKNRLDHQLIEIDRVANKSKYVEYSVSTTVWDIDPRFRSRYIRVGVAIGYLRLYKESGEIEVIYPVPGDDRGVIQNRAASVLTKAHLEGEYPVKTCYAAG